MLDRSQRASASDPYQSAVHPALSEPLRSPVRQQAKHLADSGPAIRPRLVVGLALIAGGVVWAIVRGLHFYGLTLAHVGYDLDQPPLLVVFVGLWLLYRSRRR